MAPPKQTFGGFIAENRKKLGISQKELASFIIKEDGKPIAAQYLNDIERGRRNPSSDFLVKQIAKKLKQDADYLFYLAGKFPNDLPKDLSSSEVVKAMAAFRKAPSKGKRK